MSARHNLAVVEPAFGLLPPRVVQERDQKTLREGRGKNVLFEVHGTTLGEFGKREFLGPEFAVLVDEGLEDIHFVGS